MKTQQHLLSIYVVALLVCLTLLVVIGVAAFHASSFSILHQFSQVPFYGPWP